MEKLILVQGHVVETHDADKEREREKERRRT